jgi:hypothetical protein
MKTTAFAAGAATGAAIAKALRKARPAEVIGTYKYKEKSLTVWGWKDGKAGTENKHELPPTATGEDMPLLFSDAVVVGTSDFTDKDYDAFYEEAFGGFEELGSETDANEEEEEDEEEDEDYEEEEAEEEAAVEEEDADAIEEEDGDADEEEEEEEEDEDDDCYDDGDENGGGGKRRAPRRKTVASPEYRRIDMGLRSRVKLPAPAGKRAPKWHTAEELIEEAYA